MKLLFVCCFVVLICSACTSRGRSESATCDMSSPGATPPPITCGRAISTATSIAEQENVTVHGVLAVLKTYPVAQGKSDPAWRVTFASTTLTSADGSTCPLDSFSIMVDATNGRVLAHDDPAC